MHIIYCVKPIKEERRTTRLVQGNAIGVGNMVGKILEYLKMLSALSNLMKQAPQFTDAGIFPELPV